MKQLMKLVLTFLVFTLSSIYFIGCEGFSTNDGTCDDLGLKNARRIERKKQVTE